MHGFYSGLSGLQVPVRRDQYPEAFAGSARITYYASFFNSIEINSSFYKIPQPRTVAGWSNSVGDHFRFTFKLWKEITHCKSLAFSETNVQQFFESVNNTPKKACILIQLPPSLGAHHIQELERLLVTMKQHIAGNAWRIAIEFRNRSWYDDPVYDLAEKFNAAIVIHDIPASATPLINSGCDFIYLRFHGPTGNYRDRYTDGFLSEYASYIREWLGDGKTIYAYFNNTIGSAFADAEKLGIMVRDYV